MKPPFVKSDFIEFYFALATIPVSGRVGNDVRVISVSDSIEVSRRVRNESWNAIPVSGCVGYGVEVVAVTNVIRVCCRMRNVPWPPRIDRSIGRMWNAVDMGCCMRNGVHMVSMTNVVCMRGRMRNVMVMRLWIEALCTCKLRHSKNCDGCDYDCARFQHVISP